jgi:hypothetical protein
MMLEEQPQPQFSELERSSAVCAPSLESTGLGETGPKPIKPEKPKHLKHGDERDDGFRFWGWRWRGGWDALWVNPETFVKVKAKSRARSKDWHKKQRVENTASAQKARERTREYSRKNREVLNAKQRLRLHSDPRIDLLNRAKHRAKVKGLPFNLTLEDIVVPAHCPALGMPLVLGSGVSSPTSPSLDRVIPELGYTKGNVVVISMLANQIKNSATPQQVRAVADWYVQLVQSSSLK